MLWLRPFFNLRWRLAFVYLALFSIFVLILSGFLYSSVNSLIYHNAQMAFSQRVLTLREQFLRDLCHNETLENAGGYLQQENGQNDIDAVYVIDSSGRVVGTSNGGLLQQTFPYISRTFFTVFHTDATTAFQVSPPGGTTGSGYLVAMHTPSTCTSAHFTGYLAATTSYGVERSTLSALFMDIGIAALVMILLGAAIILLLTSYMLRPLREMTTASQAIAGGDLQQRVRLPQSQDEIGALAANFNQMAERIEQAFQAQQASERRAQRFVADASHELRTPITSLRGFTEVLIRGAKDDPETAHRVLTRMKGEAERMTRLVNDLLTLAHLDEGRPLQIQDVDLVAIAIECTQQAKKLSREKCQVSLDLATQERLDVQADPDHLKQMVCMLLDNSIKYGCTAPDSSAILRLDKQGQQILIQVIDTGPGIAPEDLPHIFDRFYRCRHAPSSRAGSGSHIGGSGLGLSIALAIARAHGGDISVESEAGKRTVFTVTLPL